MNLLKKNTTLPLTIKHLDHNGNGVALHNNIPIIIPNTIPGEKTTTLIIKSYATYSVGKCLQILTPSPHRTSPPCDIASQCGGCQLQHLSRPTQTHWIWEQLQTLKQSFPSLKHLKIKPVCTAEHPLYYRNKCQVNIESTPEHEQRPNYTLGLYATHSNRIIPMTQCPIQHPIINRCLKAVHTHLSTNPLPFFNPKTHEGLLKGLVIRASHSSHTAIITFVCAKFDKTLQNWIMPLTTLDFVTGIVINIQPQSGGDMLGETSHCLWGKSILVEKIGDYQFQYSLPSFFQANPSQIVHLYDLIRYLTADTPQTRVWDLYCGVGTIGQYLSNHYREIIGIEENATAVAHCKENATLNNIKNATYYEGDITTHMQHLKLDPTDTIILDPPRKGCDKALLQQLANQRPGHIIMVSCQAKTGLRDMGILLDLGYQAEVVYPVELFPQTKHYESVCLLSLQESRKAPYSPQIQY